MVILLEWTCDSELAQAREALDISKVSGENILPCLACDICTFWTCLEDAQDIYLHADGISAETFRQFWIVIRVRRRLLRLSRRAYSDQQHDRENKE